MGKYRVIAKLGQGGMARVLLTMVDGPAGFNKLMVVKQLREELADEPEFLTMFLDEARLAARLNHRNVVHTYEVAQEDDQYFIAMEYLEGQPLNRILGRIGRAQVPLEVHLRILSETLAGLHYAHDLQDFDGTPLNVIHRDVSPQNVFVTYDGQVKLVDFGIAKAAGAANLTKEGVFKGKVGYIAPEQARAEQVDRRADIFSVGVMMWEALAGRRLTKGKQELMALHDRLNGSEPRISELELDVPAELAQICDRAMAHEREDRYRTADDFRDELDAFLDHSGLRADDRAIAQLVTEQFAEQRERLRTQVEEQVRLHAEARPSERDVVPVITLEQPVVSLREPAGAGSGDGETRRENGPAAGKPSAQNDAQSDAREADEEAVSNTGTARRFATETTPTPEGRSRLTLFVAAGVLGVAVLLLLLLRDGSGGAPLATTASPAADGEHGAAPMQRPATAAADSAPDQMTLSLTVTPSDAKVTLDGAELRRNPFSAKVKRDGSMHRIRVEREGYETLEQMVTFDRDLALSLSLKPALKDGDGRTAGKGAPAAKAAAPAAGGRDAPAPRTTAAAPAMGDDLRKPAAQPAGTTPRKIDESDPYK